MTIFSSDTLPPRFSGLSSRISLLTGFIFSVLSTLLVLVFPVAASSIEESLILGRENDPSSLILR